MSMIRELKFFLGLQIKHAKDGIYTYQTKYAKELPKKFNLDSCKSMSTSVHLTSILTLDDPNKKADRTTYRDILKTTVMLILIGTELREKIISGGCHFIEANSVSWESKRQGTIKHQLEDYDIFESNIPLLCDNIVAINLSKNFILYSRAKHINFKHHFVRDHIQKGILDMNFISINE
ncbi:hypothetical protein CR513_60881, partial [Mucuna pruriens]